MGKRESILQYLIIQLKTITGFSNSVYEAFVHKPNEQQLPIIIITDEGNSNVNETTSNSTYTMNKLKVSINVLAKGSDSVATVRNYIGDILSTIGNDVTFAGNAINTIYIDDEIKYDWDNDKISGATINIEVYYRTTSFAIN